jgi:hypothetical protein
MRHERCGMNDGWAGRTRAAYDAIAADYAETYRDELAHKPFDRALADLGLAASGLDLSPGMLRQARGSFPELALAAGSMLAFPAADGSLTGAVALYSLIHLPPAVRARAYTEFGRVIRPAGGCSRRSM